MPLHPIAARTDEHTIRVPYTPRMWARPFHASFRRFAVLLLHRRAGKTTCAINHHVRAATDDSWERKRLLSLNPALTPQDLAVLMKNRKYGHIMPTYRQAKDVAWQMLKTAAAAFPGTQVREDELSVTFFNGNKVQLFGANNPDSLRGHAFSGVSFDEYSQQNPRIFGEIISKALADHLGYAVWVGTIKGKDHLFKAYDAAKDDPEWIAIWQDIDTSLRTETGPTIAMLKQAMADDLKLIAKGLMTQDEYDQEWFLSTDAAIQGAYYAKELGAAKKQNRITRVPFDPMLPVDTDWDLGVSDHTSIWFSQSLRSGEIRIIDFYTNSGEGLAHYAEVLREKAREHGYSYGQHWAPHDIKVKELGSGKSRLEIARNHGIWFQIVPSIGLHDGINAVRLILSRCWFDQAKTEAGLNALRHYRKKWNEALQEFMGEPVHDVFSHPADAFRYFAVRHQAPKMASEEEEHGHRKNPYRTRESGRTNSWMGG